MCAFRVGAEHLNVRLNTFQCIIIYFTNAMYDLTAKEFRTNLAETIRWCSFQPITARLAENTELRRRRTLIKQGNKFIQLAEAKRGRFWNKLVRRDHTKTIEWKRGKEIIREALQISIPLIAAELRSNELAPSRTLNEVRTEKERESLVCEVILKRSGLLHSRGEDSLPVIDANLCGGRLLSYVSEENLADGAAEYESNGFLDFENVPPWDTWVAYSDRTLISWVPAELVQLVQRGVFVNPEECIRWIS